MAHVDCLKWLRQQSPPCEWNADCFSEAVGQGNLEVVKWMREQESPCPWDEWAFLRAVHCGNLSMVEWLCQQDPPCPWTSDCLLTATGLGGRLGLRVLQCLLSQDHPVFLEWKPACTENSAALGDLATLQWLHEKGFSLSMKCPEYAADAGRIDILAWLLSVGIRPKTLCDVNPAWPAPILMLWGDYGLPLPAYLPQQLQLARATFCTFHGLIRWRRTWLGNAGRVSNAAKSRSAFCSQGCHGEQLLTLLARLPNDIITMIAVTADLQHDFHVPA